MKREYKCLSKQEFKKNEFLICPIRDEDKYKIMEWRNEQIFHLRQDRLLTREDQDYYFSNVISSLFNQENPDQILFSFMKGNKCVGYGGLVHVDWEKKEGEISFIINTSLEKFSFSNYWDVYLDLIEQVSFKYLNFNRLYTYSYNIRPKLYEVLSNKLYILSKRIKNGVIINNNPHDILIHIKESKRLKYRNATLKDKKIVFDWSNEESVRLNSLNRKQINWQEHVKWFEAKILDKIHNKIFIFYDKNPIGIVRLNIKKNIQQISFSIDKKYRGKGYGFRMIAQIVDDFPDKEFLAEVRSSNYASHKIFLKNDFTVSDVIKKETDELTIYKKYPNEKYI